MSHTEPSHRPPGRIRSAWHVLVGREVTPLQIAAEWLEYKLIFEDILSRFGAQLARGAQAEKKRIERTMESPDQLPLPMRARSGKAAVRARVARMKGLSPRTHVPSESLEVEPPNGVTEDSP